MNLNRTINEEGYTYITGNRRSGRRWCGKCRFTIFRILQSLVLKVSMSVLTELIWWSGLGVMGICDWGEAVRIGIPYESWLSIMSRSLIKRCCNDFGGLSALHHLGLEQSMFRLVRGRPSWIMSLYGLPDFRLHHPPGHVTCDVIGLDQSACRAGPPSWIRSKNMFRLVWVGHLGLRRCDDFGWW